MSVAVLSGADGELPAREAALARFAVTLTAEPWSLSRGLADGLVEQGFGADAIEAATGVVAMFNYLTRVADATGIEFDYASPLPTFEPDRCSVPAPRPDRDSWPVVAGPLRTFAGFPAVAEAWQRWRGYVFDSDQPLTRRERRVLARVAAEECCDGWRADQLSGYAPETEAETRLVAFARKLSREPWQMQPADLQVLRAAGYAETALLHAISVVALQNADSRLALGLRIAAGSGSPGPTPVD
jgi:alkylhydroperoxidase family enzyme